MRSVNQATMKDSVIRAIYVMECQIGKCHYVEQFYRSLAVTLSVSTYVISRSDKSLPQAAVQRDWLTD